eukprot:scaffold684_cov345-Pavlova_lutheri.AAC.12
MECSLHPMAARRTGPRSFERLGVSLTEEGNLMSYLRDPISLGERPSSVAFRIGRTYMLVATGRLVQASSQHSRVSAWLRA